ncbi:MAG: hypothetical protein RMH93_01540 [Aquificaceae bacterium]|nr:hypothetical protein [Aquificaceae bacterium]MCS7195826.1 hypothetical protein [Aquificaceae bacterium]MDW8032215.1 hypothetical protein [Aquificaceae bacterium]MDW8293891.1 hypothetical protein [Aquificaceae bacterium]
MERLMFSIALALTLLGFTHAQQVNPFLFPERANSRINASVEIAKELRGMGYKRVAVVYMETSDLCALFSASLVASLKTLGVEAYYLKGGEGLEERLKTLQPFHVYMAYFGERPPQEVQTHFTEDLRRVLRYEKRPSLVLQPALLAMGFVNGLLTDEEISSALQEVPMLSFLFEGGKAKPVRVVMKDLEVKVTPIKPTKQQRRK